MSLDDKGWGIDSHWKTEWKNKEIDTESNISEQTDQMAQEKKRQQVCFEIPRTTQNGKSWSPMPDDIASVKWKIIILIEQIFTLYKTDFTYYLKVVIVYLLQ